MSPNDDLTRLERDSALEMLALKETYIETLELENARLAAHLHTAEEHRDHLIQAVAHHQQVMESVIAEQQLLEDQLGLHRRAQRVYRLLLRQPALRRLARARRLA